MTMPVRRVWHRYQDHLCSQRAPVWLRDLFCQLPFLTILRLGGWRWLPVLELAVAGAVLARLAVFAVECLFRLRPPGRRQTFQDV